MELKCLLCIFLNFVICHVERNSGWNTLLHYQLELLSFLQFFFYITSLLLSDN